ncbi:hypothetical protein [Hymenobacter sp. B1770]|uniref:hypothetical protein n=1 Tax=Hymenobacter sp. B1770 TaxID=1718788 RepID=UPI003CF83154
MSIHLLLLLRLALLPSFQNVITDGYSGEWKVVGVKNTMLMIGTVKNIHKNFSRVKRHYMSSNFIINENLLEFPEKLVERDGYSRTSNLVGQAHFRKAADNDAMKRWPGDELECDSQSGNTCLVGNSFMALLGNSSNTLRVFKYQSDRPKNFVARLCIINDNLVGLLLDNSQILLILKRI